MSFDPETELIAQCQRGDAEAWDRLFDLHYAPTCRFIFQLSPDFTREDVGEICQEVLLFVVKNLNSFCGKGRLQTWIFRLAIKIAGNRSGQPCAIQRGNGLAPRPLQEENRKTGTLFDFSPPEVPRGHSEDLALMGEALGQLNETGQEMIKLRYLADLSEEEIGHELDSSPETVRSQLDESLARLATLVGKEPASSVESPQGTCRC